MATKEKENVSVHEELKEIFIPKLTGSKTQPPFIGSVNGKNFSLPRNKVAKVPPAVYEVIKRSLEAEEMADEYRVTLQSKLIEKAEEEAALLK